MSDKLKPWESPEHRTEDCNACKGRGMVFSMVYRRDIKCPRCLGFGHVKQGKNAWFESQ